MLPLPHLTLLGWLWAGIATLVIAFVLWAMLLRPVLAGWKSPTVGASLLLAVCPASLAVLAGARSARISAGAKALGIVGVRGSALEDIAVGLWVLTMLWLLVLLFAEVRWPRLSVGPTRWSTVFPLGMYAVCSFAVEDLARAGAITSFARVWVWIGLATWAIVFAATIGRGVEVVRRPGPPDVGTPASTAEEPRAQASGTRRGDSLTRW